MHPPSVRPSRLRLAVALLGLASLAPLAGCSDNPEGNPPRESLSVPRNGGGAAATEARPGARGAGKSSAGIKGPRGKVSDL